MVIITCLDFMYDKQTGVALNVIVNIGHTST